MSTVLIHLALIFSQLSVLAFGGGVTILPEMQRQIVQVQHWMNAPEFSALFALSQAAPGPNMMIVPLIGWRVAGIYGLLVSSAAKFGPSSVITIIMLKAWGRYKDRPWRRTIQNGMVPITVGLVASSATVITHAAAGNALLAGIAALSAALSLKTRLHPLWLLGGGAVLGLVLL
jgi:chromate transporter